MNKNSIEHVCKKPINFPELGNWTLLYTGTLFNGLPHGHGIIYDSTGTDIVKYEGNFDNGRIKGHGQYYCDGALKSDGYHIDLCLNGQGTIYRNGQMYTTGNHENDKLQGYGKKYYTSADLDEGIFLDNEIITGKWTHKLFTYTGDYEFNRPHGYGLLELHNSDIKKIWGFFRSRLVKINEMITIINGKDTEVKLITNNSSYYLICMKKYPDLIDRLYIYNNTNSIHFCTIEIVSTEISKIELLYNLVEVIPYDD